MEKTNKLIQGSVIKKVEDSYNTIDENLR